MLNKILKRINDYRAKKHQLKLEKNLFPKRLSFYTQFIKKGQVVFDIGANMGNRVNIFLTIGAKVIAVEPQPQCAQKLQASFGDRAIIEQVGVGSKEGLADMFISSESTLSTLSENFIQQTSKERFKRYKWENKITIKITTLSSLIAKYGLPDFCKIDVEGFEPEVLKGLDQSIPMLSLEYCVPEMQQNLEVCILELNRLAPDGLFNYCAEENMSFVLLEWVPCNNFLDIIRSETFINTQFGDIYFKTIH